MAKPNNQSTTGNPVGRFMAAAGAVIEYRTTGEILVCRRNGSLDWQAGEWEIPYGRMAQFETVEEGLRREVREETGVEDLEILTPIRIWHIFRGTESTAENELIGITFHCRTHQKAAKLSEEHSGYRWVLPEEALRLVCVEGIREDIRKFQTICPKNLRTTG